MKFNDMQVGKLYRHYRNDDSRFIYARIVTRSPALINGSHWNPMPRAVDEINRYADVLLLVDKVTNPPVGIFLAGEQYVMLDPNFVEEIKT